MDEGEHCSESDFRVVLRCDELSHKWIPTRRLQIRYMAQQVAGGAGRGTRRVRCFGASSRVYPVSRDRCGIDFKNR